MSSRNLSHRGCENRGRWSLMEINHLASLSAILAVLADLAAGLKERFQTHFFIWIA